MLATWHNGDVFLSNVFECLHIVWPLLCRTELLGRGNSPQLRSRSRICGPSCSAPHLWGPTSSVRTSPTRTCPHGAWHYRWIFEANTSSDLRRHAALEQPARPPAAPGEASELRLQTILCAGRITISQWLTVSLRKVYSVKAEGVFPYLLWLFWCGIRHFLPHCWVFPVEEISVKFYFFDVLKLLFCFGSSVAWHFKVRPGRGWDSLFRLQTSEIWLLVHFVVGLVSIFGIQFLPSI